MAQLRTTLRTNRRPKTSRRHGRSSAREKAANWRWPSRIQEDLTVRQEATLVEMGMLE
jgi:hypothetical protein